MYICVRNHIHKAIWNLKTIAVNDHPYRRRKKNDECECLDVKDNTYPKQGEIHIRITKMLNVNI